MITTAKDDFINLLSCISADDPFACRIISQYNSYPYSLAFVDYWTVIDDSTGECTGAVSRCGTNFILFLTDKTNLDEVSSFMRIAGASSAICSGDYKLDLFKGKCVNGVILRKNTPFEIFDSSLSVTEPGIKQAYELIIKCEDENFVPPAFDDFYVDVNHKLRHNTMRMCGISEQNNLVAVAMTVAESSNAAVLGAVSCHPDYRKHGYGSSIVKYITNMLVDENKTVYLHRAKNANRSFYNNLGFEETGKWVEYYFER